MEVVQRSGIHGGLVCPLLGTLNAVDLSQRFADSLIPIYDPSKKRFEIFRVVEVTGPHLIMKAFDEVFHETDVRYTWPHIDMRRLPSMYYSSIVFPGGIVFMSYHFKKQFCRGISFATHQLFTPRPHPMGLEHLWNLYDAFFNKPWVRETLTALPLDGTPQCSGKFAINPKNGGYEIFYGTMLIGTVFEKDGAVRYCDKRFREELKVLFPSMSMIVDHRCPV